jgi:DNA-directed RNA polymerase subunit alpha
VTVHNPDLKIATINKKGRLEIELVVERGRGYVTAAQNKQPGRRSAVSRSTPSTRRC